MAKVMVNLSAIINSMLPSAALSNDTAAVFCKRCREWEKKGLKLLEMSLIGLLQIMLKGYYWIRSWKPGYSGGPPYLPQSLDDLLDLTDKSRARPSLIKKDFKHFIAFSLILVCLGFIVLFFWQVPVTFEANIISRSVSFQTPP